MKRSVKIRIVPLFAVALVLPFVACIFPVLPEDQLDQFAVRNAIFSDSTTTSSKTQVPTYLYVGNFTGSSISQYTIDRTDGTLTDLGATAATSTLVYDVATSYSGKFAYAALNGQADSFTIGSDGTLTNTGNFTLTSATRVQVHPNEKYAYFTEQSGNTVAIYSVDSSTGVLTASGSSITLSQPQDLAFHPDGTYLYVSEYSGAQVRAFSADSSSGALTDLGATTAGSMPNGIAVTPDGKYVYAANDGSANLSMYSIGSDGTLTHLGNQTSTGVPVNLAVDGDSKYVYEAENAGGDVRAYSINSDGTLSFINTYTSGASTRGIAATTTSVYASNDGVNNMIEFSIDSGSGALTQGATFTTGNSPQSVAVGYLLE